MSIRLMNRVYEKVIDAATQRVLVVLCDFADDEGRCWPSMSLVAWKLGISERTVLRSITRLEEMGVLVIDRRPGVVNHYRVNLEQLPDKAPYVGARSQAHPGTPDRMSPNPRQNVRTDKTSPLTPVSPNPRQNVTQPPTKCHPTTDIAVSHEPPLTTTEPPREPPVRLASPNDRFEMFWSSYPRKVGKGDARKSFARLKPDAALFANMIAALERQKQSNQWLREGGRFIPNPATWINQCRWEDELPPPSPQVALTARPSPNKRGGYTAGELIQMAREEYTRESS